MAFNLLSGKLTQQLTLHLLGKCLLISALQLTLEIVEARDSLYDHTRKRLCSEQNSIQRGSVFIILPSGQHTY